MLPVVALVQCWRKKTTNGSDQSAIFSRTLSKPERLWSCADRELLGIIMGLKNWYGLLKHTKVVVYTDSLCAKYILAQEVQTTSRRAKLVSHMAMYDDVTVEHIQGIKNTVADFLSRLDGDDDDDSVQVERQKVEQLLLKNPSNYSSM